MTRRWPWILAALGHAVLLAAAATTWGQGRLWGTHAWTYVHPWKLAALAAATAALIAAVALPWPRRNPGKLLAAAVLAPLFYLLRDATHLMGDGWLWIESLNKPFFFHAHEPLAAFMAWLGVQVFSALGLSLVAAAETSAVLVGVLSVYCLFHIAERLTDVPQERWLFWLLFLSAAAIQFAFGVIEAYPWVWLSVLVYIWAGLHALRGNSLFPAAAACGLACAVHGTAFLLGPSIFVLAFVQKRGWTERLLAGGLTVLIIGAFYFVVPAVVTPVSTPDASTQGAEEFLAGVYFYPHGPVNWLLDQLNRWTLVAPLALVLLPLGLRRSSLERKSLGFLAAVCLLAVPYFLWDTEGARGSALDADSTAVAGLTLVILTAALWKHRVPRAWGRSAAAVALFGTGAYVLMHADAQSTVTRVEALASYPTLSQNTRGLIWEATGQYHRARGDTSAAIRSYQEAIRRQTTNYRLIRNTALLASLAEEHRVAVESYKQLMGTGSMASIDWTRFGAELWMVGSADSAVYALRQAVRLSEKNTLALNTLAQILVTPPISNEARTEAVYLLELSLQADPNQPSIRSVLNQLKSLR